MKTEPKSFLVIGVGGFGFAVALVLARAGHRVTLWDRMPERAWAWEASCRVDRYPWMVEYGIHPNLSFATGDIHVAGFDFVLLATSMSGLENVVGLLDLPPIGGPPIVTMQKGMVVGPEPRTPAHTVLDRWPKATTLQMTGAGFSKGIAEGQQTLMAIGYPHRSDVGYDIQPYAEESARSLATCFAGTNVWPIVTTDITGLSVWGTLRTILSFQQGVIDSFLRERSNEAAAALGGIRREAEKLAQLFGAKGESADSSSPLRQVIEADIELCRSSDSRNYHLGHNTGLLIPDWLAAKPEGVVECVTNIEAAASFLPDIDVFPYLAAASMVLNGHLVGACYEEIVARHTRRFPDITG